MEIEIEKFSTVPIYFATDGLDIGFKNKGHLKEVTGHIPIDKSKDKVKIKIEVVE